MTGKIKLVHSGGNAVSIAVPTSNPSSSEVEFKLPGSDGSANQVLKTDGSGNLSFAADSGGKFASYAIICDQKSLGTDGGTFTSGDWRTRDLNTELADADGIVSISSNQFTLQAGTYLIEANAPGYKVNRHIIKLRQTSGTAADIAFGTAEYAKDSYQSYNRSFLSTRVTISEATTYEIQHRSEATMSTYGFGIAADFSTEIYTLVKIFKES